MPRPAFRVGHLDIEFAARGLSFQSGFGRYDRHFGLGGLGQSARGIVQIEAQLADLRPGIAHKPFGMDAVVPADAVGRETDRRSPPGPRSEPGAPDIGRAAMPQMRSVEPLLLVSRPCNVDMVDLAVGEGVERRDSALHHLLDRTHHAVGRIDRAARVVGIVDAADCAIHPDFVGNPDDVIHDVGETVLETGHGLRALAALFQQRGRVAPADLRNGWSLGQAER